MMKRKYLFLVITLAVLLPLGLSQVNAIGLFTKVFSKGLRGMPGEVLIMEKDNGDKVITGGYVLKENQFQRNSD
ncbi:MAG: hypothetical protein ACOY3J_08270 [Bacillota bacterium]